MVSNLNCKKVSEELSSVETDEASEKYGIYTVLVSEELSSVETKYPSTLHC